MLIAFIVKKKQIRIGHSKVENKKMGGEGGGKTEKKRERAAIKLLNY